MSDELRFGINPEVETNRSYFDYFRTMAVFKKFVDSCADVVVTAVSDDGKTVDVKLVAGERMENGTDLPPLEYKGIPIVQIGCSNGNVRFKVNVGDIGIIFARKFDINMPDGISGTGEREQLKSGRIMSFVQGFFFPISFLGSAEVDFHLQSGDSYVKIDSGNLEVSVTGNVNVNATGNATINATQIYLGGEGGQAVARVGDNVVAGTTVIGQIGAGSAKVFSV